MLFSLYRFKWHQRMPKPVSIREEVILKKWNSISVFRSLEGNIFLKNKEKGSGGKPVPGRSVLLINSYRFCDQTEFWLWKKGSKEKDKRVLVEKWYGMDCSFEVQWSLLSSRCWTEFAVDTTVYHVYYVHKRLSCPHVSKLKVPAPLYFRQKSNSHWIIY